VLGVDDDHGWLLCGCGEGWCDVAVGWREAEVARYGENLIEVEADGGAGFLGYFVFDGEVEVVGTVEEAFEGALVLGEDGGADAGDVVEEDAAES